MTLYEQAMTDCTRLVEIGDTARDHVGGTESAWKRGAKFRAAIVLDQSQAARMADRDIARDSYTVIAPRAVALAFMDVFIRESDGQVFRLTSNGRDRQTPMSAGLDMRAASAEAWELPGILTDGE